MQGNSGANGGVSQACSGDQTGNSYSNQQIQRSDEAAQILADTNEARSAISQQDTAKAQRCVAAALNEADRIQRSGSSQNASASGIVPIYTEFGEVALLGPIQQQQRRSGRSASSSSRSKGYAARSATSGSHTGEASRQSSDSNSATKSGNSANPNQNAGVTTVEDVTQGFTSVTLDVNMAKDHLQAAKTALDNGDPNKADSALAAVQDSVDLVSVAGDRPLLRARQNLALARTYAREGKYDQINAPLRAAAQALDNYQSMGSNHASDAAQLSQQIRSYAANVGSNSSDAVQKIEQWSEETHNWTSTK